MKHILAIDETGSFTMSTNDRSFVCGVSISQNEQAIKRKYQETYKKIKGVSSAPNDLRNLIGDEQFHFSGMNDRNKDICRKVLLPLADKIYVSKGKPTLYANNQNWWLVAVTVVVSEFLKGGNFERNDDVKIWIDNRSYKTFGLVEDEKEPLIDFKSYHNILKEQIKRSVKTIVDARNINFEINFKSDTSSFYINLADVVCGFVRKDRENITQAIIECPCSRFMSGDDPASIVDKNPMTALTLIFQEVSNARLDNISFAKQAVEKLRNDAENYSLVWDMFYDLVKAKIAERSTSSALVKIKQVIEIFSTEFNNNKAKLPGSKCLDLMVLFIEYYSHIGQIESPFTKEDFVKYLQETNEKSETRLLRKWEKYVSFSLRNVQILFNTYNFDEAVSEFETLWGKQDNIIKSLPAYFGDKKDEPTTAIIGTLAQSYAYNEKLDEAIEYFEMSKEYAIRTTNRTDSFLFTIYHRMKNIEKAREYFKKQFGQTPEEYARKGDYKDCWVLLSYCKLRAMELYINKQTPLPKVDLKNMESYNSEYPFPLIQKWEGIALWLENPQLNKSVVEEYFHDAIDNLSKEDNGFAIKTLALPIIQCFALVNNQNRLYVRYNRILEELSKLSLGFKQYTEKVDLLNDIRNQADIWQRATLLPFIYA